MGRRWTPLGGCDGVWDTGGCIVYVRESSDGLIARHYAPYTGGADWTTYTLGELVGDLGGAWPPDGVRVYHTLAGVLSARRALRRRRARGRGAGMAMDGI